MLTAALAARASRQAAALGNHAAACAAAATRDPDAPPTAAPHLRTVADYHRRVAYDYARLARDLTATPTWPLEEAS